MSQLSNLPEKVFDFLGSFTTQIEIIQDVSCVHYILIFNAFVIEATLLDLHLNAYPLIPLVFSPQIELLAYL